MSGPRIPDVAAPEAAGPGRIEEIRRALRRSGSAWVVVSGSCMAPALTDHQPVRVRRAERQQVGDVALLEASGSLEIHRLVDRIQAGPRVWYVHMGDASAVPGLASAAELIGVAESLRPRRRAAPRAHLWGLLLRLGALLWYLGLPAPGVQARRRITRRLLSRP